MKTHTLSFGLLSAIALTHIAYADEINFGKNTPSTDQVIEALNPDANSKAKTRSIDMSHFGEAAKTKNKKSTNANKAINETALSMEILFAYKLSELTDVAKEQLRPVGEALASEKLQNLNFIVEGHTDGIGGYTYNKSLSEERADAVKHFLVDTFHIDPSRIQIIGKGKSDLLDAKNPASEVNRRVRIIATK